MGLSEVADQYDFLSATSHVAVDASRRAKLRSIVQRQVPDGHSALPGGHGQRHFMPHDQPELRQLKVR